LSNRSRATLPEKIALESNHRPYAGSTHTVRLPSRPFAAKLKGPLPCMRLQPKEFAQESVWDLDGFHSHAMRLESVSEPRANLGKCITGCVRTVRHPLSDRSAAGACQTRNLAPQSVSPTGRWELSGKPLPTQNHAAHQISQNPRCQESAETTGSISSTCRRGDSKDQASQIDGPWYWLPAKNHRNARKKVLRASLGPGLCR